MSRSQLIRRVLREFLTANEHASIGRRIAVGYERIPAETPDESGDQSVIADRASADLLHRLDAEERTAGHEPW